MSKLLLDDQPLLVFPKLATKIGLNESIILQQIHYWNKINKKSNHNYKDGHYWTYNSIKEWQEQFPFWSLSTINRTISNLEKMKFVVSGNYNKLKIDRTKWYRIDYQVLEILETSTFSHIDKSNMSLWIEHISKMVEPLPKITSEISSKNNFKKNKGVEQASTRHFSFLEYKNKFSIDEGTSEVIEYYLSLYQELRGSEHPRLKKDQWDYVVENLFTVDCFDLDETAVMDMMEQHFKTRYKDCDYNILHFMSDGVRINRMYEVAY